MELKDSKREIVGLLKLDSRLKQLKSTERTSIRYGIVSTYVDVIVLSRGIERKLREFTDDEVALAITECIHGGRHGVMNNRSVFVRKPFSSKRGCVIIAFSIRRKLAP